MAVTVAVAVGRIAGVVIEGLDGGEWFTQPTDPDTMTIGAWTPLTSLSTWTRNYGHCVTWNAVRLL